MAETIRLTHYDARWKQEFQQTRSGILFACEGRVTEVLHVGSTAVPGLVARPIVDVIATVSGAASIEESAARIEGLNYRHVPPPDWSQDCLTLVKPRTGDITHCVYLVAEGDPIVRQMLDLVSHLSSDPESRIRFESAKVHQWKSRGGNPEDYDRGKSLYLVHLLEQLERGSSPQ